MKNNHEAWAAIFHELKILQALDAQPLFNISAKQINEIGKREARLMAKFDTQESLPDLFKRHALNINAVSNGNYIIFKDPGHSSFIKLPDYKQIVPVKFKPKLDFDLQTLTFSNNLSESGAIDYAHHAGILSEYCGEDKLKLTTRGRFYAGRFDFELGSVGSVVVKGVQVEVDAGYEGREQFLILEAKSSTRATFNIRQLYYPYRHFQTRTNKNIRTVLLSFSNGIYYFSEIELFPDYYAYKITRNVAFEVEVGVERGLPTIEELLMQETYTPEDIPVPQADDINKVIDLVTYLVDNPSNKYQIAGHFEFDERQGDYYANAGCYIGLLEKVGALYQPTHSGKSIALIQNRHTRNVRVIEHCLQTALFNDISRMYFQQNGIIADEQIINRIAKEGLTGSTPQRRKSTILAWMKWIAMNLEE